MRVRNASLRFAECQPDVNIQVMLVKSDVNIQSMTLFIKRTV